jgi:hypothetical protein
MLSRLHLLFPKQQVLLTRLERGEEEGDLAELNGRAPADAPGGRRRRAGCPDAATKTLFWTTGIPWLLVSGAWRNPMPSASMVILRPLVDEAPI